ncbi:RimK-like ATPgrasp N-terminal domain-containing protein [Pseudomonas luteola]|uniref:RimK-like ATPgrasp N-terminal domain-containing protein n=1 Tax=Pseudomonas luteola TaxID=47886 RepID=UPI003DA0EAA6
MSVSVTWTHHDALTARNANASVGGRLSRLCLCKTWYRQSNVLSPQALIVVEHKQDWESYLPSDRLISVYEYLEASEKYISNPHLQIINLCRSYRYLENGYYCSLLGRHPVIPNASTSVPQLLYQMLEPPARSFLWLQSEIEPALAVAGVTSRYTTCFLCSTNLLRSGRQRHSRNQSVITKPQQAATLPIRPMQVPVSCCLKSICK